MSIFNIAQQNFSKYLYAVLVIIFVFFFIFISGLFVIIENNYIKEDLNYQKEKLIDRNNNIIHAEVNRLIELIDRKNTELIQKGLTPTEIKEYIISMISHKGAGADEKFVVLDSNLNILWNRHIKAIGKNLNDVDINTYSKVSKLNFQKGEYIELTNFMKKNRIVYFKSYNKFNWILQTGYYSAKIDKIINEKEIILHNRIHDKVKLILILVFIFLIITLIFSSLIVKNISNIIKTYQNKLINANETLEDKVKEQTDELHKSLEIISNDIIYSKTDLDGIITEVSHAFCKISQYTKDELIGKTHAIMKHEDTPKELHSFLWHTLEENHIWYGKTKNHKKDNTSYTFNMSITPQYDKNNKKIGYMAIRHDITAQLELARVNENLEIKVKEEVDKNIAKELLLFEQSKMASMGAMIGNIAHQWKQPLSVISVIASGLSFKYDLDTLDIDTIPEETKTIEKQITHLSNTIDTFRNFLKEKKVFKEVVLQDRIDVALSISGVVLKDSGIELKNNINYNNPIKISLVVGELAEVLINIINNAKDILKDKNTQDPWVQLDLIEKKDKVIITIEDNGKGIPDDILPHIFDEYFTTKDEDTGTGLGLYMSYQIITKSLKGKLYVQNTENGAKFFIELPLN
ncbi:MAG: PAS domain S-box protein [Arcobacteraceae bacterium]|nr:PAS domain S-box protein [Arcobacteraceae bacterium]